MLLQQGAGPRAPGFAVHSVSVYIARTLGLRGGACTCQSSEKAARYTATSGSAQLSGCVELLQNNMGVSTSPSL